MIDIRRAAALRFFFDDFAGLPLRAYEQNRALVRGELTYELQRVLVERQRLLEIDDMNLVAMAEDERRHLGIPVPGLVAEMDATLQHFTHARCHKISSAGLRAAGGPPPSADNTRKPGHPYCGGCANLSPGRKSRTLSETIGNNTIFELIYSRQRSRPEREPAV